MSVAYLLDCHGVVLEGGDDVKLVDTGEETCIVDPMESKRPELRTGRRCSTEHVTFDALSKAFGIPLNEEDVGVVVYGVALEVYRCSELESMDPSAVGLGEDRELSIANIFLQCIRVDKGPCTRFVELEVGRYIANVRVSLPEGSDEDAFVEEAQTRVREALKTEPALVLSVED